MTAARAVSTSKTARLVVLGGGAGSSTLANSYAQAVKKAGWGGTVTTVVHGSKGWSNKTLAGATAVVLAGDAPAALASTMADPAFRDAVTSAVRTTPVVLADGAMTAVLGARWSAKANAPEADLDAIEAEGVAAFRADDAAWLPGLGARARRPSCRTSPTTTAGVGSTPASRRRRAQLAVGVAAGLGRRAGARPAPRSTAPRSSWPTGAAAPTGPARTVPWVPAAWCSTSSATARPCTADHPTVADQPPGPGSGPRWLSATGGSRGDAPCDCGPCAAPPAVPRSRCGEHHSPRRRTTSELTPLASPPPRHSRDRRKPR